MSIRHHASYKERTVIVVKFEIVNARGGWGESVTGCVFTKYLSTYTTTVFTDGFERQRISNRGRFNGVGLTASVNGLTTHLDIGSCKRSQLCRNIRSSNSGGIIAHTFVVFWKQTTCEYNDHE